ncbi:MAG: tetratricopeptide repeat protein [Pseudomonadota bacterium]
MFFPQPVLTYTEASREDFQRDTKGLIERLTARVQKNPDAWEDYFLLGRLFRIRGETKRALRLHRNLSVRPFLDRAKKAALFTEIGLDLLCLRAADYGELYFLSALDLQKHNVEAMEGLVAASEYQGNFERAAEVLAKLIKWGRPQASHLAHVYAALAHKYLEGGLKPRARRAVQRALKIDRDCLYAHVTLADVYLEANRTQKAMEVLKRILFRWPAHSFLVLRRLEDAHYRMNNFPEFETTLREILRTAPENYFAHYSLARHLRKKKRANPALLALRKSLEINPAYVNSIRDRIEMTGNGDELPEIRKLAKDFFAIFKRSRRFICPNCRHRYVNVTWRCSQCGFWGTFEIRYELPAP